MKKIFIISLLLIQLEAFAQNNLEINQVLWLELSLEGDTVPDGKVWKIESFDSNTQSSGEKIFLANQISIYLQYNHETIGKLPIWFPAGTILKRYGSSYSVNYLSIIEFNLNIE